MLFIFYFILSFLLCCVLEINGNSVKRKDEALNENEINANFNDSAFVTDSGSVMSKHKSLLHIIQNPGETPNLRLNIFDKMLSNEMLSIKQQLYEKNETNVSPFYITFKNSLATPTLEVKQRWPLEKPLFLMNNTNKKPNISETHDLKNLPVHKVEKSYKDDLKLVNSNRSKVLGVRSFSAMPGHDLERSNDHKCTKRQCTCMKTNPHSTCSFRCSENTKMICTHTESYTCAESKCTRNVMPLTYYPYYVYSTMFLGVSTDPSVVYYHPDVINELKLPKHKHSPIKKPSVDNTYFEEDNDQYDEEEYLENDYTEENYPQKPKYWKNKYEKAKTKKPKKVETAYFMDSKEQKPLLETNKLTGSYLHVLDRDKFIDDVVEDLKVYYSDAVIKDCYCSLSTFKFRTKNLFICLSMVITLFLYNF